MRTTIRGRDADETRRAASLGSNARARFGRDRSRACVCDRDKRDPGDVPATCAEDAWRRETAKSLLQPSRLGKREAHARRAHEVAHRDSPNPNPQALRHTRVLGRIGPARVCGVGDVFSAPPLFPSIAISARGVGPAPRDHEAPHEAPHVARVARRRRRSSRSSRSSRDDPRAVRLGGADVARGASGSLGASEARGAARATPLRVGDAGARASLASPRLPASAFASAQAVEVRGFSRLTQPHKAFHHVTLEAFDDARSSFARNECELRLADGRRVKSARRGPGWPRKRDAVLKFAKANFVANEKLSVADDRAANDRAGRERRAPPRRSSRISARSTRRESSCGAAFLPLLRDSIVMTRTYTYG